jgi:hypothetical protein
MWLATKRGFFSVVQHAPEEWHIRARVYQDLKNLLELDPGTSREIITTYDADYRYRVVIPGAHAKRILKRLIDEIDYSNFKARIAQTPDQQNKLGSYHDIWSIMYQHQPFIIDPCDTPQIF